MNFRIGDRVVDPWNRHKKGIIKEELPWNIPDCKVYEVHWDDDSAPMGGIRMDYQIEHLETTCDRYLEEII